MEYWFIFMVGNHLHFSRTLIITEIKLFGNLTSTDHHYMPLMQMPLMIAHHYWIFPYTTPGVLFRKSMLLDRDSLNSAQGLYTENSGTHCIWLTNNLSHLGCSCLQQFALFFTLWRHTLIWKQRFRSWVRLQCCLHYLILVRTFGIMLHHTLFYSCASLNQHKAQITRAVTLVITSYGCSWECLLVKYTHSSGWFKS